jgi:4-pyridoxolactonase
MRVSVVPSGSILIDHSQMYWNQDPGNTIRHPVFALLVEHPAGRVLIDSGFDSEHARAAVPFVEPLEDIGGPVTDAITASGVHLSEVDVLIHTHLHFDHVGADRLLPEATVFVHKEELRHARVPEPFEALSYSDQRFAEEGVTVEQIETDTEVLPGITMLETPGHSAGHCSVLLRGPRGQELLFCGDASYTRRNLEDTIVSGFHVDPVESIRSIRRLQRLAARDTTTTVMFPHDMDEFRTYPVAPECWNVE